MCVLSFFAKSSLRSCVETCRRLCVRLSDLFEHSSAFHNFDSLISLSLQRIVRGAGNIVAVRNSTDIPRIHVRVLVLTVPIAVLNLNTGCNRFLPLDCLTFRVLSSYWTPHIKSALNTASFNGPQCCRLKCLPHPIILDQFTGAAHTDALCIRAPNRLIVWSVSFQCRSRRSELCYEASRDVATVNSSLPCDSLGSYSSPDGDFSQRYECGGVDGFMGTNASSGGINCPEDVASKLLRKGICIRIQAPSYRRIFNSFAAKCEGSVPSPPSRTSLFPFLSGAFANQLDSKQEISIARKKEDRCQL
jgi:hypothetical protein